MLRSTQFALVVGLLALSSCQDGSGIPTAPTSQERATFSQFQVPPRSAEPAHSFVHMSDAELWQYVKSAGNKVMLGLKEPGANRGIYLDRVLINADQRAESERAILAISGITLIRKSEYLPILQIQIPDSATMVALRRAPFVDYIEPLSIRRSGALAASFSRAGAGSLPASFDISETGSSCSGLTDWHLS